MDIGFAVRIKVLEQMKFAAQPATLHGSTRQYEILYNNIDRFP